MDSEEYPWELGKVNHAQSFIDWVESNYSTERLAFSRELRLSGECPFCHKERYPLSLYINTEDGVGCCHHCGIGFSPLKFVMAAEECSMRQAAAILAGDGDEYVQNVKEEKVEKSKSEPLAFPKMMSIEDHAGGHRYLSGRGVTDEAMRHFAIHVAVENMTRNERTLYIKNRVIFPCFDADGNPDGWQARDTTGRSKAKYYNLPGWDKSQSLLNIHAIPMTPSYIIVVEGVMDLIGWWQAGFTNVVATFGKTMSSAQADTLRRLEPKILYCAWDGEAHYQKHEFARQHAHKFNDIRIVAMGKLDADELKKEELRALLETAKHSTKENKLLDMLNAL